MKYLYISHLHIWHIQMTPTHSTRKVSEIASTAKNPLHNIFHRKIIKSGAICLLFNFFCVWLKWNKYNSLRFLKHLPLRSARHQNNLSLFFPFQFIFVNDFFYISISPRLLFFWLLSSANFCLCRMSHSSSKYLYYFYRM